MVYYNLSMIDNTTSILTVVQGVNTASGGWLIGLTILCLWVLIFIVFSNYETKSVFLGSSFLISLIAGMFYGAGLIDAWMLVIPVVVLIGSLIAKLWGDL